MRLSDSAAGPRPAETIRHSPVSFALEQERWPLIRSPVSRMSSQTASGSSPAIPIRFVLLVAYSSISARVTFTVKQPIAILLNLRRFAVAEQIQSDCISGFLCQFDITLDVLCQPAFLNALDPRDDVARFQHRQILRLRLRSRIKHLADLTDAPSHRQLFELRRRIRRFDNFRGKPSDW